MAIPIRTWAERVPSMAQFVEQMHHQLSDSSGMSSKAKAAGIAGCVFLISVSCNLFCLYISLADSACFRRILAAFHPSVFSSNSFRWTSLPAFVEHDSAVLLRNRGYAGVEMNF